MKYWIPSAGENENDAAGHLMIDTDPERVAEIIAESHWFEKDIKDDSSIDVTVVDNNGLRHEYTVCVSYSPSFAAYRKKS